MKGKDIRACQLVGAVAVALGSATAYAQVNGQEQPTQEQPSWQQESNQDRNSQARPGAAQQEQASRTTASGASLDELASQHEDLSSFVEALRTSGMADALTDGTQYTVFAPTNEAFEDRREELLQPENYEELVRVLRAHIVADDVDSEQAGNIGQAQTIDGGTVELQTQDGELMVGDASVVDSDIQLGSLRIHSIDSLLEPQPGASASAANHAAAQQPSSQADEAQTLSSASSAQQAGGSQTTQAERGRAATGDYPAFEEVDTNSDGELSRLELAMVEGIDFSDADQNQDGSVSREEYEQAIQQ